MDKINIFDRYIRGEMTSEEESLFKQRLTDDAETRTELKIYAALVAGIYKEEQQDNMDFAHAMKSLSEKDLQRVIGKREKSTLQIRSIRQVGMWAASMAAMLLICFSVTLHIQYSANYVVDDLMVEYNSIPVSDRGGDTVIDLSKMSRDEVEKVLPKWCAEYRDVPEDDIQTKQMAGVNLAMAYLKVHDREKAVSILIEIKSLYPNDTEFVYQCDKILKHLR